MLDRAAHLRTDDEKLFALEGQSDSRAYVVYRNSLVVKHDGDSPRALLTIEEALEMRRQSRHDIPGLARRRGDVRHGHVAGGRREAGRPQRCHGDRVARHGDAGRDPAEELSAIAMAKSMVAWHQRHGYCANCGARTAMKEGGWKRDCPACKAEHFPRTDPVVIMLVAPATSACSAGRSSFCPACIRASPASSSRRDHRGRGAPRDSRRIGHPRVPTCSIT